MWQKIKLFLFSNTTTRQTVAKNTFWLTVSNVGGRLLRAVIIVYAARVLGAADWGVFSYAITLVGFLTAVIDFGINSILVRETVKAADPHERSRIISTAFFIKLALIIFGAAAILVVGPRLTSIEAVRMILPIVTLVFIFDAIREFGFALVKAIERMEWEAGLYLVTNAAIVVLGFAFLMVAPTVHSFAYSYAAGTAVGMVATVIALRRYGRDVISHFSHTLVRLILAAAWPFTISGLLAILMTNTDILIIGSLKSAEDVGLYSAALRIVQLLYAIPAIFTASVLPVFSRLAAENDGRFRIALEQMLTTALMLAIPMGVGGVLFGKGIISFVFGESYAGAAHSFQILMLTLVVDFTAVIVSNAIFAFNKQRLLIVYAALGGGLNVALDFLLIPHFGIVGSAWATLLAQCVSNIYLWSALKRISRFSVLPRLGRIAVATVFMITGAGAAALFGIHVLGVVTVAGIVYIGALIALKEPLLKELGSLFAVRANENTSPGL